MKVKILTTDTRTACLTLSGHCMHTPLFGGKGLPATLPGNRLVSLFFLYYGSLLTYATILTARTTIGSMSDRDLLKQQPERNLGCEDIVPSDSRIKSKRLQAAHPSNNITSSTLFYLSLTSFIVSASRYIFIHLLSTIPTHHALQICSSPRVSRVVRIGTPRQ